MDFAGVFLGVVLGGIVTLLITIWVERLRGPRLRFEIESPHLDIPPRGPIKTAWRALRIKVFNQPLPPWANWWLLRSPAQQCRGEIMFLRPDGTEVFEKPMMNRWSDSPEPAVVHVSTPAGTAAVLTNPTALKTTVDIYPGEHEILDIAVKFDDETESYGWNDETFFFTDWRNPGRKLVAGLYLVELTLRSSGKKAETTFGFTTTEGAQFFA